MAIGARWLSPPPVEGSAARGAPDAASPSAGDVLPADLPPFDIAAALVRVGGKRSLLRKLIIDFGDTFAGTMPALRDRVARASLDDARNLAHGLRGVAGALELRAVAEAAGHIEDILAGRSESDIHWRLDQLESAIAPALAAATGLRSATASTSAMAPGAPSHGRDLVRERALILIVDDEIMNVEIMTAALEEDYDLCFATSGDEAIRVARTALPDLMLLDVMMPGLDGYEVCRILKRDPLVADVPIIFTTGLGDQDAEVRGLLLGAIDYVTKPISPIVVRARVRNHIELKRMRDKLAELAVTDALTGLSNRRGLEQSLEQAVASQTRSSGWLSLIMLDIDFFKQFNDTYGHPAGDSCIVMVAAALNRAARRAADRTARYGGEEFACVLPGATHDEAMAVGQEIRNQVSRLAIPHAQSPASPYVTVSIGIATAACRRDMPAKLWLTVADRQLYLAKTRGRDNVVGTAFDASMAVSGA